MDYAALDRILKAIGRDIVRADVDKAAMNHGIHLCISWYREAIEYRTDKQLSEQLRRLSIISKTAKRLDQLLAQEQSGPTEFRASLQAFIQGVEHKLKTRADRSQGALGALEAYKSSLRVRSPIEWLVGHWLPLIYMFVIKESFTVSETFNAQLSSENGPYVRFVSAILKENRVTMQDKPYSPATLVKAVRSASRVRRKVIGRLNDFSTWRQMLLLKEMLPHVFQEP